MKKITPFLILIFITIVAFQQPQFKKDKELDELVKYMSGSFNSKEQSLKDSDYYEIHLQMKPIWKDKKIGHWLYVEQAISTALQKPYRQRVYHVYRKGNELVSEVYTLQNPMRFAGAYKEKNPLANLTPDSLTLRNGCEITLTKQGENFVGKTKEKTCPSELRGASYATSEVTIYKDKLVSWDRGFNEDGSHAWGAKKGGYVFNKTQKYK